MCTTEWSIFQQRKPQSPPHLQTPSMLVFSELNTHISNDDRSHGDLQGEVTWKSLRGCCPPLVERSEPP
jgi:hypothetical protein